MATFNIQNCSFNDDASVFGDTGSAKAVRLLYTVKVKNRLAIIQAKGAEGSTSMPESHVWEYMKHVTRIAKKDGVLVEWEIQEG